MVSSVRFALVVLGTLLPAILHGQVETRILLEGDASPLLPDGTTWEIGEQEGFRPGGPGGTNLLHRFQHFDLGAGDTALFTADPSLTTRTVIARVNGETPSQIYGTLASNIEGANLYFLNPRGVVLGPTARLDLKGSFFASSASTLRLFGSDGSSFEAFSDDPPILEASPREFGFLDAPGAIQVEGSQLAVPAGETLGLIGGDVRVTGGFLDTAGGRIDLASLRGAGSVVRIEEPEAALRVDGPRGDITIESGAVVNSSGIPLDPFEIFSESGELAVDRGAGDVFVRARRFRLEDSEIRTRTPSRERAGDVDIDLTGDLEIVQTGELAAGIFAGSGFEQQVDDDPPPVLVVVRQLPFNDSSVVLLITTTSGDPVKVTYDSDGASGDVIVKARNVRLVDGGRISATSLFGGEPGTIRIDVEDQVDIVGTDGLGNASALFSNGQGGSGAGAIDVHARTVRMAGGIVVTEARNDPGRSSGDGGDIVIDVSRLELTDNARIDSSTRGSGDGGTIRITAADSILLSGGDPDGGDAERGFSGITAIARSIPGREAQPGQIGTGGSIRIEAPTIEIQNRAEISARADAAAQGGGTITLDVETLRMTGDARIASTSLGTGDAGDIEIGAASGTHATQQIWLSDSGIETDATSADGGSITLRANRLVRLDGASRVSASVEGGAGSSGGSVEISEPELLAVLDDSQVRTRAIEQGGSGGRVVVAADLVIAEPGSFDASAPGGPEFQGTVEIESPVTNLEGQVTPPAAEFLDASSLLLAQCSARRSGERVGSFRVARWPGLPVSPVGPLLALDPILLPATGKAKAPTGGRDGETPGSPLPQRDLTDSTIPRGGHAREAAERFAEIAAKSETSARADALRGAAQVQQLAGGYAESIAQLEAALTAAREGQDLPREAAALSQLGNAYVALREPARAASYLERAVAVARKAEAPQILATTLNNLGNHLAIQGASGAAQAALAESAALAQEAADPLGAAQALANAARLALEQNQPAVAERNLAGAKRFSSDLPGGAEEIALHIHLADSYAGLARLHPTYRRKALELAHRTLLRASSEAGASGNLRLQSYAYGGLGTLYLQEGGREDEALYLTRRALERAERAQAGDLLARWHAQAGGIQNTQGQIEAAITSYARAVEVLEQTRPEARAHYAGAEASFKRAVAPVYLALVDLLLEQAAHLEGHATAQTKLRMARNTVERFRAAELRDYFQDECVAAFEAQAQSVEGLSERAAVVYPIVLPERLELLVSRPSGLARFGVPVSEPELRDSVAHFRSLLVKPATRQYLRPARELHEWLLAPYADALEAEGVDTLVVVPDGPLRTIPWAALHDGRRFAVERFAVAVTPSLDMQAPQSLDPDRTRLLLAGISESVSGQAPLPNVPIELRAIHELYGGELLLDAEFLGARLEEELRERPPGVVHIASHAEFTGDPRSSFVLTHDARFSMDELAELVKRSRFGEEPLELLTLSACKTAAGNERAALGLAGVAVRAGARSAVGSLWSVSDEASSRLMVRFYRELGQRVTTKAQAMARAQRDLLAGTPYDHPFYWAGFLVINNWL